LAGLYFHAVCGTRWRIGKSGRLGNDTENQLVEICSFAGAEIDSGTFLGQQNLGLKDLQNFEIKTQMMSEKIDRLSSEFSKQLL
jgi:hypothetical protein